MSSPTPTIMRMVLFVLQNGQVRPAVITEVHNPDCATITVFPSGNDLEFSHGATGEIPDAVRRTSVRFDQDGKAPGTFHFNSFQAAGGGIDQRVAVLEKQVEAINAEQPKGQRADLDQVRDDVAKEVPAKARTFGPPKV